MWAIDYFYRASQAAQAGFLTILGPCESETLIKHLRKFPVFPGFEPRSPGLAVKVANHWTTDPLLVKIDHFGNVMSTGMTLPT